MKPQIFLFYIFATVALASFSGCKNADNSQGLDITLANSNVYLIDNGDFSCASEASDTPTQDLSSVTFNLGSITLTWLGAGNLTVAYIAVTMNGSNIANFSQYVSSAEYQYIFGSPALKAGQPYIANSSSLTSTLCTFKFGSVSIKDKTVGASGQGRVLVYGVPDNGDSPVTATAYFNFSFAPLPH